MKNTDIAAPDYFHKVVDCQWACPAHTPVPEYIRLIAAGRYSDAYMVNWKSNVFPGIDRKSTRLNSSHITISYAVFCLKKKKKDPKRTWQRHISDCGNTK